MKKNSAREKKCVARVIIAPPDSEDNTVVTLQKNGETKSISMNFNVVLEKLFSLKVKYYAPGNNPEGGNDK